jgi:prolyl oligopeptidase
LSHRCPKVGGVTTVAHPYPPAERLDLVEDRHGHRVPDPYRWLEDPGDPRTVAWCAAQDELAARRLSALPGRDRLTALVDPLVRAGTVGVPVWRAGRAFFLRRRADQEHAVLYVREPDGVEHALVDVHREDPTGKTVLDAWTPSREGTRLAVLTSVGGDEESRLFVLDVPSGHVIEGPIARTKFSPIAWLPGGEELIYVRRLPPEAVPAGEHAFHRRVWRHKVGADPDQNDVLLHGEGLDATMFYELDASGDGRWLTITGSRGTARRNWLWVLDLHGDGPARQVLDYDDDVRVSAWVERDGRLYLHTTLGADRWRLCVADPAAPAVAGWQELVAEHPAAVLSDVRYLPGPGQLVVSWTRHAVSELSVHDAATGARVHEVPLPGPGTVTGLSTVDERTPADRDTAWIGWTDFLTPPCVLAYRSGTTELVEAAPGAVAAPPAQVRQVSYRSKDGTEVHMFLVAPDGASGTPRPALLTGYGGFALSRVPEYTPLALAWVAAGGVFALPSLRGGGEEGEAWHRAGMREQKQNVFDDFHAAAEHLVDAGWTTPAQLGIMGGSNGGLLVGAALTQRPQLYRAVVCAKPLLDMVRYERFLIGRYWNHEYGTAEDPTELAWLLAYSPYHHVVPGTAYPAVLFTSYENDARTDPCHPRKMCAALQHATASDPLTHEVLLRRETEVGHGDRAVSRTIGLTVDMVAFLAHHTGLVPDATGAVA